MDSLLRSGGGIPPPEPLLQLLLQGGVYPPRLKVHCCCVRYTPPEGKRSTAAAALPVDPYEAFLKATRVSIPGCSRKRCIEHILQESFLKALLHE